MLSFHSLWCTYQKAIFYFLDRQPPWPSFAIITACNPASRTCTTLVNRCATASLAGRLRHKTYVQLHVYSPDWCYYEHSFATPLSLHSAVRLATQFRQVAIYYIHWGCLWLVPVATRHLPYPALALGAFDDFEQNVNNLY